MRRLELLTKPLQRSEADDCGGEDEEGSGEVGAGFAADDETAKLVDPGEGAPTTRLCWPRWAMLSTLRRAMRGVMLRLRRSRRRNVAATLVGVRFGGSLARSSAPLANRLCRVDGRRRNFAVAVVRR
jgi:hypothetical protein